MRVLVSTISVEEIELMMAEKAHRHYLWLNQSPGYHRYVELPG